MRPALDGMGVGDRGAYNIASGQVCTIVETAEAVASALRVDAPTPLVTGEYRIGDVRHVTASPELARATFGFQAAVPFRTGLAEFARAPMRASLRPRT